MGKINPPVARDEVYDNFFGRLAMELDPYLEAHPIGVMTSLMAYASMAVGRQPTITTREGSLRLAFWPLLAGVSGDGGKGRATSAALEVVNAALGKDWVKQHTKVGFDTGLGMIKTMSERTDENGNARPLLIFVNEVSKIIKQAQSDGRMAGVFTNLADGDDLGYSSGTGEFEVKNPHVAVLGHVQPKLLKRITNSAAAAIGMYNRFMWVYVQRSKTLDWFEDVSGVQQVRAQCGREFRYAYKFAQHIQDVRVPRSVSKQVHVHHRPRIEGRTRAAGPEMNDLIQRVPTYMIKVAALYAIFDGRDYCTVEDFDSALALCEYAIDSAVYVMSSSAMGGGYSSLATSILRFVQAHGPCTYTFMTTKVGRGNSREAYMAALRELDGQVIYYALPGEGRRERSYRYVATPDQLPPNARPKVPGSEEDLEVDVDAPAGRPSDDPDTVAVTKPVPRKAITAPRPQGRVKRHSPSNTEPPRAPRVHAKGGVAPSPKPARKAADFDPSKW